MFNNKAYHAGVRAIIVVLTVVGVNEVSKTAAPDNRLVKGKLEKGEPDAVVRPLELPRYQ